MEKRNADGLTEKEFLEQYNPSNYDRPSVTVDMLVLGMEKNLENLKVLLIQRKNHPCIDSWALPGGFIEKNESAYTAAARELEEETGLTGIYLEQLYTMSQPDRDPRTRVITIAYMALIPVVEATAGDDAKDALWFDVHFSEKEKELVLKNKEKDITIKYSLRKKIFKNGVVKVENYVPVSHSEEMLAFDHAEIMLEGLMHLRAEIMQTDIAFNLVPKKFTLPDLKRVYEVILGKELYKTNFKEKIKHKVKSLDEKAASVSGKHKSTLYKYSKK